MQEPYCFLFILDQLALLNNESPEIDWQELLY